MLFTDNVEILKNMDEPKLHSTFIHDIDAIAAIKPGHKYDTYNKISQPPTCWAALYRYINRENWCKTWYELYRVYFVAKAEKQRIKDYYIESELLQKKIQGAIIGIENLALAYSHRPGHVIDLSHFALAFHRLLSDSKPFNMNYFEDIIHQRKPRLSKVLVGDDISSDPEDISSDDDYI